MTDTISPPSHCVAMRTDGQPCKVSQNLGPDGMCLWHSPARAQEAAATRAKGQRNARAKHQLAVVTKDEMPPLNTLEDCAEFCAWVAYAVGDGRIAHQVAKEMISAVKERRYILVIAADVHRRVRDVRQRVAANAKELAV